MAELPKFSRLEENRGRGKHDGNVRFKSGIGNMAVSCKRNASGHNYMNSFSLWTWLWADTVFHSYKYHLQKFLIPDPWAYSKIKIKF